MSIYLDTSVLVSIYIPEQQSKKICELIQTTQESLFLSRLAETEFYATLAMKKRIKELTQVDIDKVTHLFNHHLTTQFYERMYIIDAVFEMAIKFMVGDKTNLRTLDALHLACSAIINATLVTADKILAKSAQQINLPVILL